ncbi:MAG: ROK family protein [Elusimicrobia bacterium]|nr:ROK family protein [Candidatus Obscuribacterium magneticum]
MTYRVGIDFGGTSAKVGLVDNKNRIVVSSSLSTEGFPTPHTFTRKLAGVCREIINGKNVKSLGIGVAGDIDFDRGLIRVSPNLGWKNVPLRNLMQRYFRFRVVLDNDANAAAWGLYKTQVGKHVKNMIAVTLGTGIGGGLILNGQLYRGATGSAGEIGHMTIDERGRRCNCGNRGCLETYAGAFHLIRRVKEDLANGVQSLLQSVYKKDPQAISPLLLSQAARHGDRYAISVWNDVGHVLGLALGNLVYVFNPELIILTGGVSQAGDLILEPLKKTLHRGTFKTPINAVRIQIARNAPHIGLIGASLL